MHENHPNEQYFFDRPTLNHRTTNCGGWSGVCCLCAPMLGRRLAAGGTAVTVLDIDERFADVPGFRRYDVYRPDWLGTAFDWIVCDPPFLNVSISQMLAYIKMIARHRNEQPLRDSYLRRRSDALLGTFAPFGLRPTGCRPAIRR